MTQIPTRVHALIDYVVGAGLLLGAQAYAEDKDSDVRQFTRVMGASAIAYAAATDYELGIWRLIPMPTHLKVDTIWASVLALASVRFGFRRTGLRYWLPHALTAGVAAFVIAFSSNQVPEHHGSPVLP